MHHMKEYHQFLFLYSKSFFKFLQIFALRNSSDRLQPGSQEPTANIIFIEKRISCPASLENAMAFSDLSVGYTMFFSRRWMICCRYMNLEMRLSSLLLGLIITVRTGCSRVPGTDSKHYLHRKTYILPCELRKCHGIF